MTFTGKNGLDQQVFVDLPQLKNIRRPVSSAEDCFHQATPFLLSL